MKSLHRSIIVKNNGIGLIAAGVFACVCIGWGTAPIYREIPDTLDLRANARLSLNFLKGTLNRTEKGIPYFWIDFGSDPAFMSHMWWDHDENPGRYLYGLVAARQVCHTYDGLPEQRAVTEYLIKRMVYNDGMVYKPPYSPGAVMSPERATKAWMWANRSVFQGLLSVYRETDDKSIQPVLDTAVETLHRLAVKHPDGYYLSRAEYPHDYEATSPEKPQVAENMGGWITPLIKYYEWTGNQTAFELASGFTSYIAKHHDQAIEFCRSQGKYPTTLGFTNVHAAHFVLAGMLRVTLHTKNREHVQFVKRLIDHSIQKNATSFGWVAEHESRILLDDEGMTPSCETCAVADLIQCCIYLAKNGYPEYWNNVERYTRNYFEEAQLRNTDWISSSVRLEETPHETFEDISERIKGAYVGWGDVNDFVNPKARVAHRIQNCCGSHSPWVTMLIWQHIVTKNAQGLWINLSINKKTPYCEVLSWRPYEGRVQVELFEKNNVFIRVPDWADKSGVTVLVNNKRTRNDWEGDYAVIRNCNEGDKIIIEYPLRSATISEKVEGKGTYTTTWKGDTVVEIDPAGTIVPLFQRAHFIESTCPMKKEVIRKISYKHLHQYPGVMEW